MKLPSLYLVGALAIPGVVGCVADDPTATAAAELEHPAPAVPAVYLNHTYGVLSPATVTAMQTNAYLNDQFVDVELRTTVRPDMTYTGTYLNTRETYLEFFPEGTFGYPIGVTGLALGDEVDGGVEWVRDRWVSLFGDANVDPVNLVSREVDGVVVPWFEETAPAWANLSAYTGLWAMQYVPDPGQAAPRTRHQERAARYNPAKLAQNVQALIYGYPDDDRASMQRSLAAVGWTVAPVGTGLVAVSPLDTGTRRVIYAVPSTPDRIGLLAVIWQLNHGAPSHTEQLGDAVLQVAPRGLPYASLWFVPPVAADEARAITAAP
jgi:hypothetical protein